MSRPYTVRPPVRKPIDFQNAAAAAFVGVTSRSIRSTRIAFASSRRRVAKARPIPFRRIAGSTKKSFTTRSRPSSADGEYTRSEEHTSELQSQSNLVCRLLLEKKKNINLSNGPRTRQASASHRVGGGPSHSYWFRRVHDTTAY